MRCRPHRHHQCGSTSHPPAAPSVPLGWPDSAKKAAPSPMMPFAVGMHAGSRLSTGCCCHPRAAEHVKLHLRIFVHSAHQHTPAVTLIKQHQGIHQRRLQRAHSMKVGYCYSPLSGWPWLSGPPRLCDELMKRVGDSICSHAHHRTTTPNRSGSVTRQTRTHNHGIGLNGRPLYAERRPCQPILRMRDMRRRRAGGINAL